MRLKMICDNETGRVVNEETGESVENIVASRWVRTSAAGRPLLILEIADVAFESTAGNPFAAVDKSDLGAEPLPLH